LQALATWAAFAALALTAQGFPLCASLWALSAHRPCTVPRSRGGSNGNGGALAAHGLSRFAVTWFDRELRRLFGFGLAHVSIL
jgi:hypothetical protein